MESPPSSGEHQVAREAVLAVHSALAALRERPDSPEVHEAAARRAVAALQHATVAKDLIMELRAGAVWVAGQPVLPFQPDDRPFGRLRGDGIGEVILTRSLETQRVEQFLGQMQALTESTNFDGELNALLDTAQIPGVELRPVADTEAKAAASPDWHALPEALPTSPQLRAIIARDTTCNLPALAVHQLLLDAEQAAVRDASQSSDASGEAHGEGGAVVRYDSSAILQRLLTRLLAANDLGTTTWLLTEVENSHHFDAIQCQALRSMARDHCGEPWQQRMLATCTTEEMLQLSALMMQLGTDVAAQFARGAAEIAHPLSQWLSELIGEPSEMASEPPLPQTSKSSRS